MPLTAENKNALYSDAFARNAKAMLGESAFAALDLMTTRDVLNMELGVLRDELAAANASTESALAERDALQEQVEKLTTSQTELRSALSEVRQRPPRRR